MKQIRSPFLRFVSVFRSSGVLLITMTAVSLFLANSIFGEDYREFWSTTFGSFVFDKSYLLLINDGLMSVFFLLVGLEIKRELVKGELSSRKNAMLPFFAAIGGMIVPAVIYFLFNKGTAVEHGWGIPMATDIAFALAILSMVGKKVPIGLKVFLTAVAIIDDLGAVLVIAFFYSHSLQLQFLLTSLIPIIILSLLNKSGNKKIILYLLPGIFLWYCIYKSGIHATIAGVLLAFFIPVNKTEATSPAEKLEHRLEKFVNYIVLPLFALANTAILINAQLITQIPSALSIGIILGLFIGKPIGITFFSWVAVKNKFAVLPSQTNFKHVIAVGIIGGIGFTMSIFISLLAFNDPELQELSKLSILLASVLAGVCGTIILKKMAT